MTETDDSNDLRGDADRTPEESNPDDSGQAQARLAREERDAALRALAGRLAHQIRNPLAAVRAVCSGLKSEIEDADQCETLDLAQQEIDRMLRFVTATVEAIPDHTEKPQTVDVEAETADVIDIVRDQLSGITMAKQTGNEGLRGRFPRDALRVAIYSLLDHLAGVDHVDSVHVDVSRHKGRAHIAFSISGCRSTDSALTTGMNSPTGWVQPIGLLVAERFAREFGGSLLRADTGRTSQTFTLDLPCINA